MNSKQAMMEKDMELQQSHGFAEKTNNNESNSNENTELVRTERIEGTPYTVTMQDGVAVLSVGHAIVSQWDNWEDAWNDSERLDATRVLTLCGILMDFKNKEKNEN